MVLLKDIQGRHALREDSQTGASYRNSAGLVRVVTTVQKRGYLSAALMVNTSNTLSAVPDSAAEAAKVGRSSRQSVPPRRYATSAGYS